MLAARYRVVGLLGRGGMGEVYRADDLTLGQPVALKFLPMELAADPDRLERFLGEVRVARQVSHPNVCRTYDIGEADGERFLSMEYVDGEDLATLLRRIGRLPGDKVVEIARQLCAGLAAAHDKGVLHRDLKLANVMIDGRGKVRVTDFGLASIAGEASGGEIRAGTPAYMAPEQHAGREVTVRSDIYSMGLVLYEISTGKGAFAARTPAELARLRETASPASPSSVVPMIDPALERVIMRCLEKDPLDRPGSALSVAAALPGGDPLAAALAAGETPSPEMVATSGESAGIGPAAAWSCFAGVLCGLLLAVYLAPQSMLPQMTPLSKAPSILADRARQVAVHLGYETPPVDSVDFFGAYVSYMRYLIETDATPARWKSLATRRPPAVYFHHEESRMYIDAAEPNPLLSGSILVRLDAQGRLREFSEVPLQVEKSATAATEADWATAFNEAELSLAEFTSVEPRWVPPVYADTRKAWEGSYPGQPEQRLRVESASYGGKIVYFQVVDPWTRASRIEPLSNVPSGTVIVVVLVTAMMIGGLLLARYNLRLGRGDRRGASRVSLYVLGVVLLGWAFETHHVPVPWSEWINFGRGAGEGLFFAVLTWLFYLALEPYVRRRWPQTLVSWTRLLAGRVGDGLVGRDVLVGSLLGVAQALLIIGLNPLHALLGQAPPLPAWQMMGPLSSARLYLAVLCGVQREAIFIGTGILFLLIGFYIVTRRKWAAALIVFVLGGVIQFLAIEGGVPALAAITTGLVMVVQAFALLRFGLLSMIVCMFVEGVLISYPLSLDLSNWYAAGSVVTLLLPALLAFYGLRSALSGKGWLRSMADEAFQGWAPGR
ncbi:MAG TPA: serine/threonine-protein kinase [Candidatus Polarisedimenticolia bacterium]|nr:serine/threonine-protein kinase [Candidatus Polarisedimenticolia bacterium]